MADTHSTDTPTESIARETAPGLGAARVILKPRKSRPFYGRHPWVLETAIERIEGEAADGDVVELISDKGKFVARGILNRHSRLRVRLYSWDHHQALDEAFWRERLESAVALRKDLGYDAPDGACRLVYSEGDGISGLIVDRYGQYLTVQFGSLAMSARREQLIALLVELTRPIGIVERHEAGVHKLEGMAPSQGPLWGQLPDGPAFIREHGLRYGVDLVAGQKTGYYLDQRENRRAAAAHFGGRRVLDLFCYSGGFSLAASALGHAREVVGIDSSGKAIALAQANAALNGIANVQFGEADCFHALDDLHARRERFDAVVLDPPKFTRSRQSVEEALRAYHRINRLAVELLTPGGILVTCSCSGSVSREDFMFMLSGAAQQSGRDIQVLEQRGASADHPVSATCLESEYLKCFICRVR